VAEFGRGRQSELASIAESLSLLNQIIERKKIRQASNPISSTVEHDLKGSTPA
jgi:hypothetical protein